MESQEIAHKKRLVQLAGIIRRKYETLKRGEERYKMKMERKFQPLLSRSAQLPATGTPSTVTLSKKSLAPEAKIEPIIENEANSDKTKMDDAIDHNYDEELEPDESSKDIVSEDSIFGLVKKHGGFFLGKVPVRICKNVVTVLGKDYSLTPGLLSLLTRKNPVGYDENDLQTYKMLLLQTNAHKTASGNVRSKKSHKYKTVVGRILETSGAGLREMKYIRGAATEYVYWDDINELVDRLYLLHSSVKAGNSSPLVKNEILNIEEELREANIIV